MVDNAAPNPDYVVEGLWPLVVRIDTLVPMEGNPRRGDVEAVRRSLQEFKQRKPIVAMADGTITAGHHMHAAAVMLGWEYVAAVFEDEDPVRARAFALADNRTSDLGRYDNELLVASLQQVRDADLSLLEATSFTPEDIEDLLSYLQGPTHLDDEGGGGQESSHKTCPACGFEWE